MLKIEIPENEVWDESKQQFITLKGYKLTLEHSLYSISKWEQKWHKPFMGDEPKSREETCSYISFMNMTAGIPENVFNYLPDDVINTVNAYINDSATATWFSKHTVTGKGGIKKNQIVTSELVYYWMIELGIPLEFEKRHFNHLMTLIEVINIKHEEQDPKSKHKMSQSDIMRENAKLNAQRRKALHSKG